MRLFAKGPFALALAANFFGLAAAADVPWGMREEERSHHRRLAPRIRAAMTRGQAPGPPDTAAIERLRAKAEKLRSDLSSLPPDSYGLPPPDVEIWERAASLPMDNDEWLLAEIVPHIERCLDWGQAIAHEYAKDPRLFTKLRGSFVLGYRSSVDRTAQFYAIQLPPGFDPARPRPYRLNVFLHGRSGWKIEPYWLVEAMAGSYLDGEEALAESSEGFTHDGEEAMIVIRPFARYNGGYRDASEMEVWEAIRDVSRRYRIDTDRVVLSGFSMGGGGTMRVGMRSPGRFSGIAPLAMAIFAYAQPEESPDYRAPFAPLAPEEVGRSLQAMRDTGALASNGKGLPILMGVGTKDRLFVHHRAFESLFDEANVGFESYYVGGVGHQGGAVQTDSYHRFIRSGRRESDPTEVHFTTLHLAHSERAWLRIEGMERHYKAARVFALADPAAGLITIETQGVTRLSIEPAPRLIPAAGETTVLLDGDSLVTPRLASGRATFQLTEGTWRISGEDRTLRKRPGLTGPLSDAFTKPFLCVRPTGTPWNPSVDVWAETQLKALQRRWLRDERGLLPVKDDSEVTEQDIEDYSLVLFGDPGSNSLLGRLFPKMEGAGVQWTSDSIRLGSKTFPAASHGPVLVYPNPESPDHYLVVNAVLPQRRIQRSGSTTQISFEPPIGDFAVVDLAADAESSSFPVLGGFFNESWQLEIK
ncbi:MAG: hypothetical protein OXN89_08950 [Bryobacterales bacterium]|nr:hypothetical protein [Bryobacterales bacterium]